MPSRVMRPHHYQALTANDVTELTLKTAPQRALGFLQAAFDPKISAALAAVGWTIADADQAYGLLAALRVAPPVAPAAPKPDVALEAVDACEAWQAGPLIRARARLQLAYPEQAAFIFYDFVPAKGMEAVLNVTTFLARRELLSTDPARKAMRKLDREALALLDKVGISKDEIKRLAKLVEESHHVAGAAAPVDTSADTTRLETLRALYTWLMAWSDIARTVIVRRDQLIRLGLAKRRPAQSESASKKARTPVMTPPAAPALPTPTPTPSVTPTVTSSLDEHGPGSRAA